jgi:DNA polymerase III delta prime subunit
MKLNPKIISYLDRLAVSRNRPSSYIFAGQNDEAKEDAAFLFVSKIAGKAGDPKFLDRIRSGTHPDVVIVAPEIEEKKGKTREKEIGISQARDALERIKFFPYELEQKFCLIKKAQKMNQEASNALLKSLEEPSEKTFFVLLASDADSILPTIVSRCAVLRFPETELPVWDEANREKMREIFKEEMFSRFDFVEKISKNKNEMIAILRDWELVMAQGLRNLVSGGEEAKKIAKVVELIEGVRESLNRIERTNASLRSVGERLMLDM